MSIKRFAAKKDKNQDEIVTFLRGMGASVKITSDTGVFDLIIGYRGITVLAECKGKGGRLTDAQVKFMESWHGGRLVVLKSVDHALAMLNSIHDDDERLRSNGS